MKIDVTSKYKILSLIEKKDTRFTAIIEYKNKKAILKKLTTNHTAHIKKFLNEIEILTTLNKTYIPKIYEHGDDYIIMEYFESLNNTPKDFSKYINKQLIENIIENLIDLKTTKLDNIQQTNNRPLFNIYKVIIKLWRDGCFKFYHLKVLFLLTYFYFKNKHIFLLDVATKGDFTELNILVKNQEIKFIDFDSYCTQGAWLEDASYLLLHQDIEIEELSWQKDFFQIYINKIDKGLNKNYILFWLIHTSIRQFSIRYNQHKNNLISLDKLNIKEEHIKYFLDDKKFNKFLIEIGII